MSPIDNKPALVRVMAWRRQAITLTNADPAHWRIYAALGGEELNSTFGTTSWNYIFLKKARWIGVVTGCVGWCLEKNKSPESLLS